ncbi:MAG TPA: hypothetical protein VK629_01250 [Steroidobacteraceae bacterium]|nr:hypothetical protein [Steroidobacteraceae bacterium]
MALHPPSTATITLMALVPIVAWRTYARFKRMVGRQRLSKYRPWITLVIMPAIVLLLVFAARTHPERLALLFVGLAAGAALGVFGIKKTKFESTPTDSYYTPNAHLGIALSTLFVARIFYRMIEVFALDPTIPRGLDDFARSPLTLSTFGLLAGYYISYALGLLQWRSKTQRAKDTAVANDNG